MEADNFARYLRESTLSSLPEVPPERLSPGGRAFLDGVPDAADEVFLKIGLQQNVAYAGRCGLFFDVLIRITGDQNDRGIGALVSQAARQVDATHGWHFVVDHEAVGVHSRWYDRHAARTH